jgi:subtilisin family serine protease
LKTIKLIVLSLLFLHCVVYASNNDYFVILTEPITSSESRLQSSSLKASVGTRAIDTSLIKNLSLFKTYNLPVKNEASTGSMSVKAAVQTSHKTQKTYIYRFELEPDNVDAVKEMFKSLPSFQHFQPNYRYYPQFGEASVPTQSSLYQDQKQYMDYMKFPSVWDYSTGNGVIVAVIDSGIDEHHIEFCNVSIGSCAASAADSNIFLPKGFPSTPPAVKDRYLQEDYFSDGYADIQGHGTHVAGIIGAQLNNYEEENGIVGAAYGVKLMPLKVLYAIVDSSDPSKFFVVSKTDSIVSAIDYAVTNNADIINLSLGACNLDSEINQVFQLAVNNAHNAGVLIVAASGNKTKESGYKQLNIYDGRCAPAYYVNTLAVNSAEYDGSLENYSHYGGDVSAYGGNTSEGRGVLSSYLDSSYVRMQGTSMAAPFVSALAALIQSYYMQQNNGDKLSPDDLSELITKSAYRSSASLSSSTGYGVIDAQKAFFYLNAYSSESDVSSLSVDFEGASGNHSEFLCYPNPLYLKESLNTECVFFTDKLGVYDFRVYSRRGELVFSKRNISLLFGRNTYYWNGLNDYSQSLPNGVYQVFLHIKYEDTSIKPLLKKHFVTVFN